MKRQWQYLTKDDYPRWVNIPAERVDQIQREGYQVRLRP